MTLHKFLKLQRVATVGKRTSGSRVGHKHSFVGAKNLCSLSHEIHATHHNHVGVGLGGMTRQRQRVAYEVSDLLNFVALIIMV